MVKKIISGGQTGVDQAALDVAMETGLEYGGWLPAGRRTERGPLPQRYANMQEMPTDSYPERTRKNIEDADATLIISCGSLSGGSALTAKIAEEMGKPWLHVDLAQSSERGPVLTEEWLSRHEPEILNIAGPRASSDAAIYERASALLRKILYHRGDQRRSNEQTEDQSKRP